MDDTFSHQAAGFQIRDVYIPLAVFKESILQNLSTDRQTDTRVHYTKTSEQSGSINKRAINTHLADSRRMCSLYSATLSRPL